MAIATLYWGSIVCWGGDDGYSGSVRITFGPSNAMAVTSLSGVAGRGLLEMGISQYTYRIPEGWDEPVNYGAFSYAGHGAIPIAYDPNMTTVTATLWAGPGDPEGVGTVIVYFFE